MGTDGYTLRLFCIGFTSKRQNQIRKRMVQIMTEQAQSCNLKELVKKFIPEAIGKEIEKQCNGIYPLHNVYIRKVKMLKKPKFDVSKLMEMHQETAQTQG